MSRRAPRKPLRIEVEALERRQLLSQGGGNARLALAAASESLAARHEPVTPRPDLDAFASALVHHQRSAERQGLGELAKELLRDKGLAAKYGWGSCLVMEIGAHPAYAAHHHLTALVAPAPTAPALTAPAGVPAIPQPPTSSTAPPTQGPGAGSQGANAALDTTAPAPPAPAGPPAVPQPPAPSGPVTPSAATPPLAVRVGTTLDMKVPAPGLSGPDLTFTITPQPLPANMTFDRGTGELVFSPAPDEVGDWKFSVAVSDGKRSLAVPVSFTVAYPRTPSTVVTGQVVDVSGLPLPGVPVMIGGLVSTTDLNGNFSIRGVPSNPGPLTVDGMAAGGGAGGHMMLMAPVNQFLYAFTA